MKTRILLGVVGLVFVGLGGYALIQGVNSDSYPNIAVWLVGALVLHDGVLAAIVAVAGWLLTRLLPDVIRPIVQAGLVVGGILVLLAIPVLSGGGKDPANPTILPLNYTRNIVIILIIVSLITGILIVTRLLTRRQNSST